MFQRPAYAYAVPGLLPTRPPRARGRSGLTRSLVRSLLIMASVAATHAFAQTSSSAPAPANGVYDLIVGTYTGGKSEGLYVYRFDTKTGEATPVSVAKTVNPSYLVVSRDRRFVYAVNELPGDNGPASQRGSVSAFGFDPASGQLTFLDKVSSEGNDPCYLSLSPDGQYLFTQDLGTDKLYAYRYTPDGSRGLFGPTAWRYTDVKAGTGPRHLVFGNDGRYAYLTSELAGTVSVFRYRDGQTSRARWAPRRSTFRRTASSSMSRIAAMPTIFRSSPSTNRPASSSAWAARRASASRRASSPSTPPGNG